MAQDSSGAACERHGPLGAAARGRGGRRGGPGCGGPSSKRSDEHALLTVMITDGIDVTIFVSNTCCTYNMHAVVVVVVVEVEVYLVVVVVVEVELVVVVVVVVVIVVVCSRRASRPCSRSSASTRRSRSSADPATLFLMILLLVVVEEVVVVVVVV